MSEWQVKKLGEVASLISEKIDVSGITREQYISTDNMLPNLGGIELIDKLPEANRCNYFQKNDVLFSNIRTYFKKVWKAEFSGGCSADVLVFRTNDTSILLNDYLYLILCSDDFIQFTVASSNGAKMPRGDKKAIMNYECLIPPLSEQEKLSKEYLSFDKKIQLNTETNRTLEQIAQAIFKHWFIDFAPVRAKAQARAQGKSAVDIEHAAMMSLSGKTADELAALATDNPTAYTDLQTLAAAFPDELTTTEHGDVPKGWEVVPLIELFTFIGGAQPPKSEHIYEEKEGYVRFVQNRDYANENHKTFIPISKKNKLCNEKDILMDKYGEAGKVRFGIGGAYNVALAKIEPKQPELLEYLRWHFMQKSTQGYLSAASMASTRSSLNSKTFTGMMICIPPEAILSEFNRISTDYIDFSLHVKKENASLENTRDVLLPTLLNGEIEL
ncbi:restriction endonuclease subunit S [Spirabiliibacterium falconis]|uniref:restriction endonuclease subunit S n=1 Tax=Spirabiliibacterium falconis TaxID=572023 RepID=UPI001AADA9AB|nr:restriction endonuclease subunit S [Spirabiliibacterium falconis]MBE2893507.1 restriction endonuclease subunit S [Spirabiliibacterium falconis]